MKKFRLSVDDLVVETFHTVFPLRSSSPGTVLGQGSEVDCGGVSGNEGCFTGPSCENAYSCACTEGPSDGFATCTDNLDCANETRNLGGCTYLEGNCDTLHGSCMIDCESGVC